MFGCCTVCAFAVLQYVGQVSGFSGIGILERVVFFILFVCYFLSALFVCSFCLLFFSRSVLFVVVCLFVCGLCAFWHFLVSKFQNKINQLMKTAI